MQRGIALLICLSFLSMGGCASYSRSREAKRATENAAKAAAQEWLEMLDAGNYDQAFERKSSRFPVSGPLSQFERYMHGRRAPFGRVVSRKFIGAVAMTKLVGFPDGEYETILFKTNFEHKSAAAERVILAKEAGRQQVIEYRVY